MCNGGEDGTDGTGKLEITGEIDTFDQLRTSSLMVNVDYLELVSQVGEREAWETLGKLKDLLG